MNANALELMKLYSTTTEKTKPRQAKNPHRIVKGKVFIQPTGGPKKDKPNAPYNFSYCYYGMADDAGKHLGGISLPNASVLEAVNQGLLSQDFALAFQDFAEKYAPTEVVIKM